MSKQQLHLLAVFGLFLVLSVAACEHATPFGAPGMQPRAPEPVIGSEHTEVLSNADVAATVQALAQGIPPNVPADWIPNGCSVYGHSWRPDHRLPWFLVLPNTPNFGDQVLLCPGGYRILSWDVWRDQSKPDDRYYYEVSAMMVIGCWQKKARFDEVPVGIHDPNVPSIDLERI